MGPPLEPEGAAAVDEVGECYIHQEQPPGTHGTSAIPAQALRSLHSLGFEIGRRDGEQGSQITSSSP